MRFVELLIPKRKRDAVEGVLEDEDVDCPLIEEESHDDPSVIVTFPFRRPWSSPYSTRFETRGSTRTPTP